MTAQLTPLEMELLGTLDNLVTALDGLPVKILTGPLVEAIQDACTICDRLCGSPEEDEKRP